MSRVRPLRSGRARRRIALGLAILWLFAFEVLPWAHIALHDHLGAHHHDETGAYVLDHDDDHHDHTHTLGHDDDLDADVDEHAPTHDDDDLDAEVDEHGAAIPRDDHDTSHHHDDLSAETRLAAALAHGQHSLAHHGVALPTPAPVLTEPLPICRRPIFLAATAIIEPISYSPGRAVARGPPTLLPG